MQLRSAMQGHDVLFNGKPKKYKEKKIHLDVRDDAHPIHCKPFPVPHSQGGHFQNECAQLCAKDGLEPVGATEHAYPTFIIP
jgi:hypothetical protein